MAMERQGDRIEKGKVALSIETPRSSGCSWAAWCDENDERQEHNSAGSCRIRMEYNESLESNPFLFYQHTWAT